MSDPGSFWAKDTTWPTFDPPGWVFLARAAKTLGEAMFGDAWKGDEPGVALAPVPIIAQPAPPRSIVHLGQAEDAPRMARVPSPAPPAANAPSPADQAAAYQRWSAVKQRLAQEMAHGRLRFALRRDDGVMVEGAATLWNVDNWQVRFDRCRLNPDAPSSGAASGQGCLAIFVSTEGLARIQEGAAPAALTWRPYPDQTLTLFVAIGGAAEAEARRRLKADGYVNPAEADVCARLAELWHSAGRATGSAKSITTLRQQQRN